MGFKRIFKSEVDLLIKLEEDADAETKVDNLLDRGLISEIKALNYKFEINCSVCGSVSKKYLYDIKMKFTKL